MTTTTNQFNLNKKHGLWVETLLDETTAIGIYNEGSKEGDWLFYQDNICVKKVRFANNLKNGIAQSFFPNGNIKLQMHYENDRINGLVYFYTEENVHLATYTYMYDKLSEVNFYLAHPDGPPKNKTFLPKL
ncbi:MAG: hypothetical protein AAF489_00245 [Bacteroidota bacterium]